MRINGEKVQMVELTQDFDIKGMRKKKGLAQADVARHCNVSLQAYQRWENNLTKTIPLPRYNALKELLSE